MQPIILRARAGDCGEVQPAGTKVDPLLCACGGHMRIVSFVTDPRVAGRILRHRESERCMPHVLSHLLPPSSDFLLYSRIEMLIDHLSAAV